ncbi:hypothetical protein D3C81_1507280 [compost metagenome]
MAVCAVHHHLVYRLRHTQIKLEPFTAGLFAAARPAGTFHAVYDRPRNITGGGGNDPVVGRHFFLLADAVIIDIELGDRPPPVRFAGLHQLQVTGGLRRESDRQAARLSWASDDRIPPVLSIV